MPKAKRQMKPKQIPAFVNEVIKAGCNIRAVGDVGYVIGDIDEQIRAADELDKITNKFGERDLLKLKIVDHLRLIGRGI